MSLYLQTFSQTRITSVKSWSFLKNQDFINPLIFLLYSYIFSLRTTFLYNFLTDTDLFVLFSKFFLSATVVLNFRVISIWNFDLLGHFQDNMLVGILQHVVVLPQQVVVLLQRVVVIQLGNVVLCCLRQLTLHAHICLAIPILFFIILYHIVNIMEGSYPPVKTFCREYSFH